LLATIACREKTSPVEKTIENGTEVIVNHLPSNRNLKPRIFDLKQEIVIDLSSDEFVKHGLSDPAGFEVDSEGNIYVWTQASNQDFVYKLNSSGALISAFARQGQGPGEVQFVTDVGLISRDELMVVDSRQGKSVFFDFNGNFLRQRLLLKNLPVVIPQKNGNFITANLIAEPSKIFNSFIYNIRGPDFEVIKEIGKGKYYKPNPEQKFPAINPTGILGISTNLIFFANSEKGYEIEVFDKSGKLIRIIRKEFIPVPLSGKDKEALLEKYAKFPPEIKNKVVYPNVLPPFQTGFADEDGRLFVMTNEESDLRGQYWHDVFDKEGLFIGRVSIGNYGTYGKSQGFLFTLLRNGLLYHFRENPAGFKEIVVYKIK